MFSDAKQKSTLRLGGGSRPLLLVLLAATAVTSLITASITVRAPLQANAMAVRSMADVLVNLRANRLPFGYVLVPLFMLFLQNTLKNDFDVAFVLRSRSRQAVWRTQAVKVLCYSLLLALYFTVCGVLFGRLLTPVLINWDSPFGAYYNATYSIDTVTTYWHVLPAFYVSSALTRAGTGLLFMVLWWAVGHPLAPWLAVLILQEWDTSFATRMEMDLSLLFGRTAIDYTNWQMDSILPGFAVAAVFCLALYLAGRCLLCRRKEFYG